MGSTSFQAVPYEVYVSQSFAFQVFKYCYEPSVILLRSVFFVFQFLGWPYSSGFINDVMLKEHMPPPGPDTQILMCGPPPMINYACVPNLEKLGYTPDMYFPF